MHRLVLCKEKEEYKDCAQSFIDMHRLHGINSAFSSSGSSDEIIHALKAEGRFIFGSDKPIEQQQFRFLLNLLENTEDTVYLSRTDLPEDIELPASLKDRFVVTRFLSIEKYIKITDCYIHFYDKILFQTCGEDLKCITAANPLKMPDKTALEVFDTLYATAKPEHIMLSLQLDRADFTSGYDIFKACIGELIPDEEFSRLATSKRRGADYMLELFRLAAKYPALKKRLISISSRTIRLARQDITLKKTVSLSDILFGKESQEL
ncbi:hypothetical protein [Seleniivibrio woodruffii]|uniref:hypothetical protein n=1 Tax=Seleniivibrio woodruffii TaxID=1078050 RepID=UPI002409126B|nr:hypothetical protein [Seleniivibrio woodruffii]